MCNVCTERKIFPFHFPTPLMKKLVEKTNQETVCKLKIFVVVVGNTNVIFKMLKKCKILKI